MKFQFNDGGRAAAGFKGSTDDCVTRAIAIATGIPYQTVYDELNDAAKGERITKRRKSRSSSRTGVHKVTFKKYLDVLGWVWTPTMLIGQGCKVHVKADELPAGVVILSLSKHLATVIDGVLNDTFDCSREESRCVYGYWAKK